MYDRPYIKDPYRLVEFLDSKLRTRVSLPQGFLPLGFSLAGFLFKNVRLYPRKRYRGLFL
jgi:hypothetical protein